MWMTFDLFAGMSPIEEMFARLLFGVLLFFGRMLQGVDHMLGGLDDLLTR